MDLLENVSVAKDLISTINDVWKKSRQTANDDGKEFHDKISNTIKETCNSFQKKYLIADEYKDIDMWNDYGQEIERNILISLNEEKELSIKSILPQAERIEKYINIFESELLKNLKMSFEFTLRPRTTESQRRLLEIPVEKIVPNPNQPRVTFDDDTIAELAQSISQVGLIQPLVVRRSGSGYELVAGERRLRACKSLGMETVTCIVEDSMQEESSAMVALIENLQREDLHYMEEAQCYYALLNNYNLTQEELAKRLGRSQSSIANKLRLLRLSPDVVSAIRENGLSERHARAVLKLKDEEVQLAVIKRTAEKNLSVKDTERLVEKTLDKMYDEKRPGAAPRPAIIRQVRDYRLFMNTVNSAIAVLRESGMNVEVEQEDLQNGVDIHIRITNE